MVDATSPRRAGPALASRVVLALALIAHVAIVLSILTMARPVIWPLHNDTIHRKGPGADFYAVYHAALSVQRGQDPYAVDPDGVTPYFYAFRYLPIVAMAARPLTALPPRAAYGVWVLALEALLAGLLFALWRHLPDSAVRPLAAAALLVNSPYFLELFMGQFTFAATALCALALLVRGGPIWFTGSVLLKPFTLAALPALVTERRYRWHGVAAIAGLVGLSLPYFIQHPVQRNIFLDANFNPVGGLGIGNVGVVRVLALMVEDWAPAAIGSHPAAWMGAFRLVVLGATALLVLRARSASAVAGVASLLLAHFLTYQQVWEHHASGIVVLGVLLLTTASPRRIEASIVLAIVVLALPTPFGWFDAAKDPAVFDPTGHWPRYALYAVALSKAVPTALLFACALGQVRRNGLTPWRAALSPTRLVTWRS